MFFSYISKVFITNYINLKSYETNKQTNKQTLSHFILKKVVLLLVLLLSFDIYSQELIQKQLEVEKKIEKYISKSLKNYTLSKERIDDLKRNVAIESKEHSTVYNEKAVNNSVAEIKKSELRRRYFELNPKDLLVFTNPKVYANSVLQTCTDGGFETWHFQNQQHHFTL